MTSFATPKQISFLQDLVQKMQKFEPEFMLDLADLSREDASRAIDTFLMTLKRLHTTAKPVIVPRTEVTEGFYILDDEVFKVQQAKHGSGHLYAKKLSETGTFEFAQGAVRKLGAAKKLTKEEAGAYGKLYGKCICCGRTLTDEYSIEHGIGPVCAGRL
jgi:hypothetical protein